MIAGSHISRSGKTGGFGYKVREYGKQVVVDAVQVSQGQRCSISCVAQ